MNRPTRRRTPSACVLLSAALLAGCQQAAPQADATAAPETATSPDSPILADLVVTMGVAEEKIVSLAEAMPEETYGWRPMEGVRSVGEVYLHVAADNYFIPVLMGVGATPESGITEDYATVQAYEGRELTKAEILEELRASFRHLERSLDATKIDLDRELAMGPNTFTVHSLWTQAITHLHEHLGQGIAYARSNRVTPPWSGM